MRFTPLLLLAGPALSFVIPGQQLLDVDFNTQWKHAGEPPAREARHPVDRAMESKFVEGLVNEYSKIKDSASSWLESKVDDLKESLNDKKPNRTIYELITSSKYTTKLAKLVSEDEELVSVLNGTAANYTLFAPTDRAFEKIPDHGHEPSKELIKSLLLHHVSDGFYPAGRVLKTYTIPTLHKEDKLGGRQRLSVKLGLKGLTLNLFSKVIAVDIFATNGVIHAVDTVLFFPPPAVPILEATPQAFSTLVLGLTKTGLLDTLREAEHVGGTFFAPPNRAFAKLGAKANAFLFSKYGLKYLKPLLQYHVVFETTLYSDALYAHDDSLSPSGSYDHLDLPTQLEGRDLPVDVFRTGPFVTIKANGYGRVVFSDGAAQDGVIHAVNSVLIPPKKHSADEGASDHDDWDGESELSVAELVERLEPYVDDADTEEEEVDESSLEELLNAHEHHGDADMDAEWRDFL